jgi:hypothetical protein
MAIGRVESAQHAIARGPRGRVLVALHAARAEARGLEMIHEPKYPRFFRARFRPRA